MGFTRIAAADYAGKGNVGQPDTPGLSVLAMQQKMDELSLDVLIPKHNGLIDELEGDDGAASLGLVTPAGRQGTTVQEMIDELSLSDQGKAEATSVLLKTNTTAFVPTGAYQPATKKYVDETVVAIGTGDMARAVYDSDGDGKVDAAQNADQLGGEPASYYAAASAVLDKENYEGSAAGVVKDSDKLGGELPSYYATAADVVPKAGGTFTGAVTASNTATEGTNLRNSLVQAADETTAVSTGYLIYTRK